MKQKTTMAIQNSTFFSKDVILSEKIISASKDGNTSLITSILKQTPSLINVTDHLGNSPIMCAAMNGHYDAVIELHKYGASLDQCNSFGTTAFLFAASYGYLEIVKCFLEHDVSMLCRHKNHKGETALNVAIKNGQEAVVDYLFSLGAGLFAQLSELPKVLVEPVGKDSELRLYDFTNVLVIGMHYKNELVNREILECSKAIFKPRQIIPKLLIDERTKQLLFGHCVALKKLFSNAEDSKKSATLDQVIAQLRPSLEDLCKLKLGK